MNSGKWKVKVGQTGCTNGKLLCPRVFIYETFGEGGTPLGVTEEVNKRNIVFICSPADSYLSTSSVSLRLTAPPHRGSTPKFVLNHTSAPPYMKVLPERTFPKADKNSVGNRFYFHNRPFFTSFNFPLSTFHFPLSTFHFTLSTFHFSLFKPPASRAPF